MNSDHHKGILLKHGRELGTARPDICHQTLLALFDSPLNRENLLQVYMRTTKNVLIEIHPQVKTKIFVKFFLTFFSQVCLFCQKKF